MTGPGPGETLDALVGDWSILQLADGHRFSTDDLVTAWVASEACPQARRLLDLGAGIGSVGLMTLCNVHPDATLVMVEAQEVSHALARRTVALNGLDGRIQARHGDLRDASTVPEGPVYDLVTGSPPYIPVGKGAISPHPQRAGARIELRGDVFDYCAAAARALAPQGTFCFVHSATDPRPEQAVDAAGLALIQRTDVVFRAGRAPMIAVFRCAWSGPPLPRRSVTVRDDSGAWTDEWEAVRRAIQAPGGATRS